MDQGPASRVNNRKGALSVRCDYLPLTRENADQIGQGILGSTRYHLFCQTIALCLQEGLRPTAALWGGYK
jgi:hypothetical protein